MQGLIYITGLSGAGKSTLALKVIDELKKEGIKPVYLDGDELRECIANTDYSRDGRFAAASSYVKFAKLLVEQGFVVVLSTISMFKEIRDFNRKSVANYVEVFLDVSEEVRKNRDSKKLFVNNAQNIAGVNQAIELPENSDLIYKDIFNLEAAAKEIINALKDSYAKTTI